jgi:hypothetical protein
VNCALALVALVLFVDKKEEFVTGYSIDFPILQKRNTNP